MFEIRFRSALLVAETDLWLRARERFEQRERLIEWGDDSPYEFYRWWSPNRQLHKKITLARDTADLFEKNMEDFRRELAIAVNAYNEGLERGLEMGQE